MRNLLVALFLLPMYATASTLLVSYPYDIRDVEGEEWLKDIDVLVIDVDYFIGLSDETSLDSVPGYSILDTYNQNKRYVKVFPIDETAAAKARTLGPVVFEEDDFLLIEFYGGYPAGFDMKGILNIVPLKVEPINYESDSRLPKFQYKDDVSDIVASVDETIFKGYIQDLEDFVTRECLTTEYYEACLYVKDKFEEYGYTAELDEFTFYGYTCWNVVAEKQGLVDPDVIYLITAHLDSYSFEPPGAPGADDNASGSANVIEAARVMKDYGFNYTTRFVCFGAEEYGLFGSEHYAEEAYNNDEDIQGVVNLDMILYAPQGNETLWIPYNNISQSLAEYYETCAAAYVPDLDVDIEYAPGVGYSDHASFWQYGFAAILGIEEAVDYNPYFHTPNDLLANYLQYFPFGTNAAKASIATLASLAVPYGSSGTNDEDNGNAPYSFTLYQSYPNPCRGIAEIAFALPETTEVNLSIYDTKGRKVSTLVNGELPKGEHTVSVSGLAAGVYLYSIEAGEYTDVKKMIVTK